MPGNLNSTTAGEKGDEIDKFLNNAPIPYSFSETPLWRSAVITRCNTKFIIWSVYVYTTCIHNKYICLKLNRYMKKLNVLILPPAVHMLHGTQLLIMFRLVIIHRKILSFNFQSSMKLYTNSQVTDDFKAWCDLPRTTMSVHCYYCQGNLVWVHTGLMPSEDYRNCWPGV